MISKEEFTKLINDHRRWEDILNQIYEITRINIFESELFEYSSFLFEKLIKFLFTEEAQDDIFWWMWEKTGNPDMKMWDKEGKEIPTETIEDLWEIVKDNRKW